MTKTDEMHLIYRDCIVYGFSTEITRRVFIRNGFTDKEIDEFLEDVCQN